MDTCYHYYGNPLRKSVTNVVFLKKQTQPKANQQTPKQTKNQNPNKKNKQTNKSLAITNN